jgi:hypothetical protein
MGRALCADLPKFSVARSMLRAKRPAFRALRANARGYFSSE